jgi:hypothetical protein
MACGVDSRVRGNDCTWERLCLANDTSTPGRRWLQIRQHRTKLAPVETEADSLREVCAGLVRYS